MTREPSALFTDLYQLTMMQGYELSGIPDRLAVFDLFLRRLPYEGGYAVAAGLEDVVRFLTGLRFLPEEIAYLRGLGLFREPFLRRLSEFRFHGDLDAVPEGTLVFPWAPILRVTAPIGEAQLVETALLNLVNFETLVATKAARVCGEAGWESVVEFGLRRAHGPDGGFRATRAAFAGGCAATSNVEAGRMFGIPVRGTMSHSWVTAFDDEIAAFRAYAAIYPDDAVLLVDTYDTLASGVPNAIRVGLEMRERGERLLGIRLDSGDLAYLSSEARRMLDAAGLTDARILASNEIDEWIVHDLRAQGAAIDSWGIGTSIVTGKGDGALTGVYKLAAIQEETGAWLPKRKRTDAPEKSNLPGIKQVYRLHGADGYMMGDLVELESAPPDPSGGIVGRHPILAQLEKRYEPVARVEPLLRPVLRRGSLVTALPGLQEIRGVLREQLERLHPTSRRLLHPHVYKVSIGPALRELLEQM
ncbi:MAG: nicotinate phosphoribosyltransferase [Candidatus Eisenbacteria bacterium]|nr:nicotinate phosphoribosyltransferase [Candidatus Eisenbacteria bacterium]